MQRPLVDIRAHLEPGHFNIIKCEMFRTRQHMILGAGYKRHTHRPHMKGVFRIGFLGAPPTRVTKQINRRREDYIAILRGNLQASSQTNPSFKLNVKGCSPRNGHGKGCRHSGSCSSWSVNHPIGRNVERFISTRVIKPVDRRSLPASYFMNLLLQIHVDQKAFNLDFDGRVVNTSPYVPCVNFLTVESFFRTIRFHRVKHCGSSSRHPQAT